MPIARDTESRKSQTPKCTSYIYYCFDFPDYLKNYNYPVINNTYPIILFFYCLNIDMII